jgi:hypothetical protein
LYSSRDDKRRREAPNDEPPTPHPTSVSAESTLSPLPSHTFLDVSRRYPAREVVDFWEGPIPVGTGISRRRIRRKRRLWRSGWTGEEGDEARIIRRAVGPLAAKNELKQIQSVHSRPAMTTTRGSRKEGALEIASPGMPLTTSRKPSWDGRSSILGVIQWFDLYFIPLVLASPKRTATDARDVPCHISIRLF